MSSQSDVLYVFDPLALQQVLTKDGVYYEQPSFAYSFVVHAKLSYTIR